MGVWEKLKSAFSGGDDAAAEPPAALFEMKIEDSFSISGRGTIVTGRVSAGSVRLGETVVLRSASGARRSCRVTGIEKLRKTLDAASAGDDVGILLSGVDKADVARGDVLSNA